MARDQTSAKAAARRRPVPAGRTAKPGKAQGRRPMPCSQSRAASAKEAFVSLLTRASAPGAEAQLLVRDSREADLPSIRDLYAREVLQGLASFEEVPPALEVMAARRQSVLDLGLPHLAAELNGGLVGFSYAAPYRPRPAYRHTVENSVYVAPGQRGRGVGRALLTALIERCEAGPWRQMVAVVGDSGNAGSIGLHARLGFRRVGTLQDVGFKLGRFVDTVLMQRPLDLGGSATSEEEGAGR